MSKESLRLVEAGGGTDGKITPELPAEPSGSKRGRALPLQSCLSGRKAKRVVPQRFAPLSLCRDKGVFFMNAKLLVPPLRGHEGAQDRKI